MSGSSSWAVDELAKVDFGDKRLNKRLLKIADAQSLTPQKSINAAAADWSCAKGAYRLFDNQKVTADKILEPHHENTIHRIYGQELVVIAQDTTFVDFSSHFKTYGLGAATRMDDGYETKGIHFHAGLALSCEGTPLGLLYSKLWSRRPQKKSKYEQTKMPITKKESYRWIECLEQTKALIPSGTRALVVADRECDIYEYFEAAQDFEIDVLVRLNHDRVVVDEFGESLRVEEVLKNEKSRGKLNIHVPGNGSRIARDAIMEIKFAKICLQGKPRGVSTKKRRDLQLSVVRLEEKNTPMGKTPLKWTLLTSLPVETFEQAQEMMKYYRMRWTIELFFKSLKTGCNVEKCRLDDGEKLIKFIALCGVIAWRIMWLTWLGRELPQASGELALTEVEWKVLWIKKHKDKIKAGVMKAEPPETIPDLCTVTKLIASLGGFMNRKGDGNPGLITITRGWMSIMETAEVYEILAKK